MPETTRVFLRRSLLAGYAGLKARLARRLGSADLAADALHETWLRLEQGADIAPVANPDAYLYRAALNTATNLRVAGARHLSEIEIDAIYDLADDAPSPERVAIARDDVARLAAALAELTARQQDIFRETFANGTPQSLLADRHGVSLRTVQADLQAAVRHCARRLGRKTFFGSRLSGLSER